MVAVLAVSERRLGVYPVPPVQTSSGRGLDDLRVQLEVATEKLQVRGCVAELVTV